MEWCLRYVRELIGKIMGQESIGIKTTGADHYVAAFTASEQAEGQTRVIQLVSIVSGKIDQSLRSPSRSVASSTLEFQ